MLKTLQVARSCLRLLAFDRLQKHGPLLFLFILFSCSDNHHQNESENVCSSLSTKEDILEFTPLCIKTDEKLSSYIKKSYEGFINSGDKLCGYLNEVAEFKNLSANSSEIDKEYPRSVAKETFKFLKTLGKAGWNGLSMVYTASDFAFDYKTNFSKFKKRYSASKIDSLKHVMHFIALNNIYLDNYLKDQKNKIDLFQSIRSTAKLPDEVIEKSGFDENIKVFDELVLEANRIIRILFLNEMKSVRCAEINSQINEIKGSWLNNNLGQIKTIPLFENYLTLLKELKEKLSSTRAYEENNPEDLNENTKKEIAVLIVKYEKEVLNLTDRLNIYRNLPSTLTKLKSEIRKGGEIYFE